MGIFQNPVVLQTAGVHGLLVFAIGVFAIGGYRLPNLARLPFIVSGLYLALAAGSAFSDLAHASSLQLFSFVTCLLGCLGSALLIPGLEPGKWHLASAKDR